MAKDNPKNENTDNVESKSSVDPSVLRGDESYDELLQKSEAAEKWENKSNRDDYRIYNYLVKTPAIFIAIISGLIAIGSFIINYATYFKTARELKHWNVDYSLISSSDKNIYYTLCFAVIFVLVTIILSSMISKAFMSYIPYKECVFRTKKRLSVLKKANMANRRALLDIKKSYIRSQKINNGNDSNQTDEIIKQCDSGDKEILALKKELHKMKRTFLKDLIINVEFIFFVLILSDIVLTAMDFTKGIYKLLISAVVLFFAQLLIYTFINLIVVNIIVRMNIKKNPDHKKALESSNLVVSRLEYPIYKIFTYGFKSLFTNTQIYTIIINILLSFIIVFFIEVFFPINETPQKQFKCLSIDDTQYVAVYSNPDMMILEEAEICENKLKVYTSKQRIIPTKGTCYEVLNFNEVRTNN